MDDENDWRRQLLVGMGVLVGVAILVGGIIGIIAVKAADVAGIGSTPSKQNDRVVIPTFTPTTSPTTSPNPPAGTTTSPPNPPKQHPRTGIRLTASPTQAGTYQRVNLTGTYQAPPGTSLQVQRKEGSSWVDFPTSANVNAGQFSTYIETGRPGANQFRVVDSGSGKTSNIVTVRIS